MTKPPTWMERWRGKPAISAASAQRVAHRRRALRVEPGLREHRRRDLAGRVVAADQLRQPVHLVGGEAERLAHVADGRAGPVADDLADHAGAVAPVALVDVLDDLLAPLVLEVDVDVGRLAPLRREEALEEQPHAHRVDGGDAEHEADGRVGRAAPPLAEDAALPGEADHVPDGEEVARVAELLDERRAPGRAAAPRRRAARRRSASARPRAPAAGAGPSRPPASALPPSPAAAAASASTGGSGCSPRISSSRKVQEAAISAAASSPSGKSAHSRAISSGPFSVRSALGKRRRPTWSTRGAEPDAGEDVLQRLAAPLVGVDVVHHRHRDGEPPPHAARPRRCAPPRPATRWRDTVSARRRPKASRSRAATSASAPAWRAKRPRARSATARKGSRGSGGRTTVPSGASPSASGAPAWASVSSRQSPAYPSRSSGEQGEPASGPGPRPSQATSAPTTSGSPALAGPGVGPHHAVEAVRDRRAPAPRAPGRRRGPPAPPGGSPPPGRRSWTGSAARRSGGPWRASVEEAVEPEPAVARRRGRSSSLAQPLEPGPVVVAVEGLAPPLAGEPLRPGEGEDGAGRARRPGAQ